MNGRYIATWMLEMDRLKDRKARESWSRICAKWKTKRGLPPDAVEWATPVETSDVEKHGSRETSATSAQGKIVPNSLAWDERSVGVNHRHLAATGLENITDGVHQITDTVGAGVNDLTNTVSANVDKLTDTVGASLLGFELPETEPIDVQERGVVMQHRAVAVPRQAQSLARPYTSRLRTRSLSHMPHGHVPTPLTDDTGIAENTDTIYQSLPSEVEPGEVRKRPGALEGRVQADSMNNTPMELRMKAFGMAPWDGPRTAQLPMEMTGEEVVFVEINGYV